VLRGQVGVVRYELEVDHAWRPRRAVLAIDPDHRRRLSSDGHGRWWLDGQAAAELEGCTDVGLPMTPAALQPVVRRMALGAGEGGTARLAVLPVPSLPVTTQDVTWSRNGAYSYTRQVGDDRIEVEVDRFGLPIRVADRWLRTSPIEDADR
jgi:hypothetical protein